MLKFISNEPNENEYQCDKKEICDNNIQKKKMTISKKPPKNNLQRKRPKFQLTVETNHLMTSG